MNLVTIVNNTVLSTWTLTVDHECSNNKELCDMMEMLLYINVYQINMMYTLNLYNVTNQSYLNKTGKKNKRKKKSNCS